MVGAMYGFARYVSSAQDFVAQAEGFRPVADEWRSPLVIGLT